MPCYYPLKAWRSHKPNPETGKRPLVFGGKTTDMLPINLACGRCIGCRLERSRTWATRCVHESQLHDNNCFITLTFNDKNLNPDGSLVKEDFQKFMKRLRKMASTDKKFKRLARKKFGKDFLAVKFFHCGEYGEKLGRPHHHACLFNFDFPDKEIWQVREGITLYRSKFLEKLWPYGFCTIGAVTFESAAYVARYVVKKILGEKSKEHYGKKIPEYCTMSRGGTNGKGLAYGWLQKFKDDVYPHDNIIIRGKLSKVPKYYDKIYELTNPKEYGTLRNVRIDKARDNPDNTPRRLNTRAEVQRVKASQLVRPLQ